jgi:hypothetical protein
MIRFTNQQLTEIEPDLYKISVTRELRQLKQDKLINYEVSNKIQGKYVLLLLDEKEKFNKTNFIKMFTNAISVVEANQRITPTSTVAKMLANVRNISSSNPESKKGV